MVGKYQKNAQRVPYGEHPSAETLRDLNWELVRIFRAIVKHGSLRGAAKELGMALNTVRRQLEFLETSLGYPLFIRQVKGVELTPEGEQFFEASTGMEKASYEVRRLARKNVLQIKGRVRISVTEGLGVFWLVPRLAELHRTHPLLIIELNTSMQSADLSKTEADISIQLERPIKSDLKLTKLGRLHIMPFASPDYLRLYGTPTSLEDLEDHKIVEQISPQLDIGAVDRLFPHVPREGFVSMVTNTSSAHYWAVARGAGLGMLPTYSWSIGARIQPVELGLHVQHDIWMTYHPDSKRIKRVALTIEWLKDAFNPKKFPWFADNFISPEELDKMAHSDALVNMFEGFASR